MNDINLVLEKLDRIESSLGYLLQEKRTAPVLEKEWFSTHEVAEILQKTAWTVRQWCRMKRVNAQKRLCGRGPASEWMISRDELQRIRNEGLLPIRT
jgi:hypothetical protein